MSDKDYFRLALEGIEDDLKVDFKSGLGFGLIKVSLKSGFYIRVRINEKKIKITGFFSSPGFLFIPLPD